MSAIQTITILGSTGSIGQNTLKVIAEHKELFHVFALTAAKNTASLLKQCQQFQPRYVVLTDKSQIESFAAQLKIHALPTKVLTQKDALSYVASHSSVDTVMSSISGSAGLIPTFAAAKAGKKILLANKESLVMAGKLLIDTVKENNATLLPVDSEHNAIFQCLPCGYTCGKTPDDVRKIILTASGGPFRTLPLEKFSAITIDQALAHPNWKMGKKISIDSATMMNKVLEVIEAHYLFNLPTDQIDVIIHPESIIHSCVQYQDGSTLAQMGISDMRIPITYALFHPKRATSSIQHLNFETLNTLSFEKVDLQRFPLLKLAFDAINKGGTAPIILNAANEVAVNAFLSGKIKFTDIAVIIQKIYHKNKATIVKNLEDVIQTHHHIHHLTQCLINS
jgi:1-deoxy-D-xylulose-5-phosphate reductoisomerase